jgi:predicted GNAT family acetyltransferase
MVKHIHSNYCISTSPVVLKEIKHSFIHLKNISDEAKLEYNYHGNVMDMYHTEVPPSHQGKGIAAVLAQVCIGPFQQQLKNVLMFSPFFFFYSSYLQKYYHEHPKEEYRTLVV